MEFSALYDDYFSPVYNYVRCRVIEASAAEDVCSQIFEKALSRLETYDSARGTLAPWLFGIARNAVNHHFRMRALRSWLPLGLVAEPRSPDAAPDEALAGNEVSARMLAAVERLPKRERDLIGLKFYSGLNNREIAGLTGLSESNVGTILHRSISKLREDLAREGLL